ncbi:branched-chain amino acid aminotransferase [Fonsecaea nubica]|uniref:Branched-chain amino acid aminotransferase n=1 Tax=Fonsecaea nubica TaxID=856822 RepID=A0A178BKT9_9EURO|nr:branched-chain amino acid aminotransferase [Fonsecaea nubica]OAL17844.1 branched-chain amino acid aminotransferase [Fonsecaea nubica]
MGAKMRTAASGELELGATDTDHMAIAKYADDTWQTAAVVSFANPSMHPTSKCFQYGQTRFEGMQAHKTPEGKLVVFRPEKDAQRSNKSGERVEMPERPESLFLEMLEMLVWAEHPTPLFLAVRYSRFISSPNEGEHLSVVPAAQNAAVIIPLLFHRPVRQDVMAVIRHCFPMESAKEIQQSEVANIFFVGLDEVIWIPSLDNHTILDGITQGSVCDLGEADGIQVKERHYFVKELLADVRKKRVVEVFFNRHGWRLVVVGSFYHPDVGEFIVGDGTMGPVTQRLRAELLGI